VDPEMEAGETVGGDAVWCGLYGGERACGLGCTPSCRSSGATRCAAWGWLVPWWSPAEAPRWGTAAHATPHPATPLARCRHCRPFCRRTSEASPTARAPPVAHASAHPPPSTPHGCSSSSATSLNLHGQHVCVRIPGDGNLLFDFPTACLCPDRRAHVVGSPSKTSRGTHLLQMAVHVYPAHLHAHHLLLVVAHSRLQLLYVRVRALRRHTQLPQRPTHRAQSGQVSLHERETSVSWPKLLLKGSC
jgi:hypothetical protein